jgi:hypothetical protein
MNTNRSPVETDMSYAQSPPLAEDEWFTDPVPADAPPRNPDARSDRRVPQRRTATAHSQAFGRKGVQEIIERPSAVGRFFRRLFRFVVAVSIGVGGTIAAQTDMAKQLLAEQAPTLAWVLSVAPVKSLGLATPVQQIGPTSADLDAVRRSVDQLAARQDQMTQSMMALQAVGEDIRQKMSYAMAQPPQQAPAAALPQQTAPVPSQKPAQARAPSPAAPRLAPPPGSPVPSR